MRVAVIDVGTNTVRLLTVDGAETVARETTIVRLGEGVDDERRLRSDAIDRAARAVRRFADVARAAGAERIRVAGTSALRDASNAGEFADAIAPLSLEILTGPEEGRLAFAGATARLDPSGRYVVCDIGGGSTELVTADGATSVDVGSVRVRERCLRSDPPQAAEIDEARSLVAVALDKVTGVRGDETLVGVAGTVTTIASLVLGLQVYDPSRVDGAQIPAPDVAAWTQRLLAMRVAQVRSLPTMEPGRADVIASGALILDQVMRRWGFGRVLVSERDILDGLAADTVV